MTTNQLPPVIEPKKQIGQDGHAIPRLVRYYPAIIRFLQRPDAKETWFYERPPILLIELLCLLAGIWAAPTREARWLLAITAPLSLWGTELGRRARSGAARKAELAEAMGVPVIKLRCERDIEQATKNQQLVTAAAPVVGLVMSVAGAGGAGLTKAAVVGFIVSVARWAMIEIYGAWRRWYRSHVPVKVTPPMASRAVIEPPIHTNCRSVMVPNDDALADSAEAVAFAMHRMAQPVPPTLAAMPRKSPAEEYEDWRPSEGLLTTVIREASARYNDERIVARAVDDYLRDRVDAYSFVEERRAARKTTHEHGETARAAALRIVHGVVLEPTQRDEQPSSLAPTSPYQSGELARMAEQILRARDDKS